MFLGAKNTLKVLPIIIIEEHNKEKSFLVQTNLIPEILIFFKNHFRYQFKVLTCISGIDYPKKIYRFQIVYELLSLKYNARIRIRIVTNELLPVKTVEHVYPAATWWECEIWDMFGIFFSNQNHLTRLLTDYGFQGHPLRKDFPLMGFIETRFNFAKNRVVYEKIELAQEYRVVEYVLPWDLN